MARTLKEAPLTTRNARKGLGPGIHWRSLDADIHLGYRKKGRGGVWVARWYVGEQKYRQETLETADDVSDSDGKDVLDYYQAASLAVRVVKERRLEAQMEAAGPPVTVRAAVEKYSTAKENEIKKRDVPSGATYARKTLERYVLSQPELADTPLYLLTDKILKKWVDDIPSYASKEDVASTSIKRIVTPFKAALNAAYRANRSSLPRELESTIKHGLAIKATSAAVARHGQALPDDIVTRFIDEAFKLDAENGREGDLYRFVLVLASTGARFSQVARIKVSDLQPSRSRIMIPVSYKGNPAKDRTHVPFPLDDEAVNALLPACKGRSRNERLLERWYTREGKRVEGKRNWIRLRRGVWKSSSQLDTEWGILLDRVGSSNEVVQYAFRHSSIVRMLRHGLPVSVVADLHDTSIATIEKHYAAEIVDALSEMVAGAALRMKTPASNVTPLKRVRK